MVDVYIGFGSNVGDRLDNISIDYAIMEKTDKCVVLPSDFGWSDIGSWKSLYDFLEKDGDDNVIDGDVITHETRNCFLLGHDRLIATNRLKDLVVVETPDSVFVSDLEHSRDVKTIVSELKQKGRREFRQHRSLHLPWGVSRLLEQRDSYTATELRVYAGATLQLTAESATTQHFVVARGRAKVICAAEQKIVEAGQTFNPSADDGIAIENAGAGELHIVHVRLN